MQKLSFSIYPRLKSRNDPFLENLTRSLEAQGATCSPWAEATLTPWSASTHVLNWPENLWSNQPGLKKKIESFAIRRVLELFLWVQSLRGNPVVMLVHNAKPHSFDGKNFWARCQGLTKRIDVFCHFSRASVTLLRPLLGENARHEIIEFPVAPPANSGLPIFWPPTEPSLVLLGVREKRKNLHHFLLGPENNGTVPIIASGFRSSTEFLEWNGVSSSAVEKVKNVQWLGPRATAEELSNLLRPPNKLLLNQKDQLNSGLMWLALAHGAGVIAPRTPSFEEISESLPEKSIQLFVPPLAPEKLKEMMRFDPPGLTKELFECHSFDTLATSLIALSVALRRPQVNQEGA